MTGLMALMGLHLFTEPIAALSETSPGEQCGSHIANGA